MTTPAAPVDLRARARQLSWMLLIFGLGSNFMLYCMQVGAFFGGPFAVFNQFYLTLIFFGISLFAKSEKVARIVFFTYFACLGTLFLVGDIYYQIRFRQVSLEEYEAVHATPLPSGCTVTLMQRANTGLGDVVCNRPQDVIAADYRSRLPKGWSVTGNGTDYIAKDQLGNEQFSIQSMNGVCEVLVKAPTDPRRSFY